MAISPDIDAAAALGSGRIPAQACPRRRAGGRGSPRITSGASLSPENALSMMADLIAAKRHGRDSPALSRAPVIHRLIRVLAPAGGVVEIERSVSESRGRPGAGEIGMT